MLQGESKGALVLLPRMLWLQLDLLWVIKADGYFQVSRQERKVLSAALQEVPPSLSTEKS